MLSLGQTITIYFTLLNSILLLVLQIVLFYFVNLRFLSRIICLLCYNSGLSVYY